MPGDLSQYPFQPAEGGTVVSHWPHLRGRDTTARIMWSVAAALLPAAVASGYFFGIRAYLHIGLATATAVLVEAAITRLRLGRMSIGDGSAVVTGLLVAFCLPAQARWFVPIVASGVAIAIAKQCFGGLGCNIWNPALIGRAFVHIAFPIDMNPSSYPVLEGGRFLADVGSAVGPGLPEGVQAITGPSPMALLKHLATAGVRLDAPAHEALGKLPSLWDMAWGSVGGSIGETSAVLLVLGAIYLIARGWVRWQIPLAYVAVVAAGALLLPWRTGAGDAAAWQSPILMAADHALAARFVAYHLLGGGLVLGAFFMATDMVTTPLTGRGMLVFGAGCGVLTILIRLYGGYPEAVCYSILLMNTVVPLIDRWTQPRLFGHER